jgi:hypothetical protein
MPDFVALGNEKIYCVGVGVCDGLTSLGSARVERGDAADLMYIDRRNTCHKALIAESVLSSELNLLEHYATVESSVDD